MSTQTTATLDAVNRVVGANSNVLRAIVATQLSDAIQGQPQSLSTRVIVRRFAKAQLEFFHLLDHLATEFGATEVVGPGVHKGQQARLIEQYEEIIRTTADLAYLDNDNKESK